MVFGTRQATIPVNLRPTERLTERAWGVVETDA